MSVEIQILDVEKVLELRHRVLRAGLPRKTALFPGDELNTSRHFAAVNPDGRILGCLTLHLNECEGEPAYQLRGMATDDSVRGTGVGKQLIKEAETFVLKTPVQIIWCNARVPAVGFYLHAGWKVVSPQFDIPTAGPHVRMIKRLSH